MKKISTSCPKCVDGVERISAIINDEETVHEITCRTCGGSGRHSTLSLSDDLIDLFNDMVISLIDIKQKVDEIKAKLDE